VLSGAENLSPPNEIETDIISESRRLSGYRLACQTRLTAAGDASVIGLAEQMRRQAVQLMTLQRGAESTDNLTGLIKDCAGFAFDFVGSLTDIAQSVLPQLIDAPPSVSGMYSYMRDGQRMIERVLTKPFSTGKK